MTPVSYLMDTNAFNNILDSANDDNPIIAQKARGRVYVTHHQADEINSTPKEARRAALMGFLQEITPDLMPTKTCVVNTSRLGMAQIDDGGCYREILTELDRRHSKNNNEIDALIGETAEKHVCVLVSDDRIFSCAMRARGVRVVGWRQFVAELTS